MSVIFRRAISRAALARVAWVVLLIGLALPAEARYRQPTLKRAPDADRPTAGAARTLEASGRGDTAHAVVSMTAPGSFQANSGVTTSMHVGVTVSSARGGTAEAKLILSWYTGIAMLNTPDSMKGPTEPILATAQVVVPKGGTATLDLAAGVTFTPLGPWDEANRSIVYRPTPAGGGWDTSYAGLGSPQYQALMHTYSEGRVGLGGSFELQVSMGGASIVEHFTYTYDGKAEYFDEEAAPARPQVSPVPLPTSAPPRPAADREQAASDAARAKDIAGYAKLYERVLSTDTILQDTTLRLRLYGLAAQRLREQIRKLQRAAKDPALYGVAREEATTQIEALQGELAAILKAQDVLIGKTLKRYQTLHEEAAVGEHNATCGYTREGFRDYRRELEERLERMEVELYLAAGRREKFDELAQDMVRRHVQPAYVYRLRAADYLANGQPRAAVYALQKGLAIDPEDGESRLLLWQLEDGYLRALADRARGRPAEVRARLEAAFGQHGEPGWFGAIRDLLTTGITTSVSAVGGRPQSLTDLAVTEMDEAVVEHAGLQLILSLRYHGLSLPEISQLNQDKLWLILLDRYHIDPAGYNKHDDLLRMRKAITLALHNPDVVRLMAPSREQFAVEGGEAEEDGLSRSWQDQIGDAVNVANTMMLLGPTAVIGTPGRAARMVRGATAELPEAYTLSDGFAVALRLDDVALAMGKTVAGRAALKQLLLFDRNAGVVSKLVAQTLVKQGLIQGADQLGGQPAKVAMQVLTALGLGDMPAAARLLRSQGLNEQNVEALLVQLHKATALTVKVRVPLADTVKIVRQVASPTVAVPPPGIGALNAAAQGMGRRAKETLKIVAQDPANSPAIVEANQQRALQEAVEDAVAGRSASANAGLSLLGSLERRAAAQAQEAARQLAVGERLVAELKALPAPPGARPAAFPPRADAKRIVGFWAAAPTPLTYTGLIVDCRGQGVVRAFLPAIVDAASATVYAAIDTSGTDADTLSVKERVVYHTSLEEAARCERAGPNPLVVMAVGSSGPISNDRSYAVISLSDARRVAEADAKVRFIGDQNVCFVVDRH